MGIIFALTALSPRISHFHKRERIQSFENFLNTVKSNNTINPRNFWELREFYSPGYFTFNPEFINTTSVLQIKNLPNYKNQILAFHSPKLTSQEYILKNCQNTLAAQDEIIFSSPDSVIFKNGSNIVIKFIKPIDDMVKSNGLFDYTQQELDLLNGTCWLVESELMF